MIRVGMTVIEMATDAHEGRYLLPLVRLPRATWRESFALFWNALTRTSDLLRYAKFLRGRDEDRAEFLQLLDVLSRPDAPAGSVQERQVRYRELLGLLAPFQLWVQLVQRVDRVLNCGAAPAAPAVVRFRYRCPNRWETLAPTDESGVRYCEECRRNVYYCDSAETAARRARQGDCITVPAALTQELADDVTKDVMGRPDVLECWGARVFAGAKPDTAPGND